MNIQKASDQGAQNLQKLMADKSSRDQREEQQGIQNVDLLKNCVFSSILPIKLDLLGAFAGSADKAAASIIQTLPPGISTIYSKKKPCSFFLSLFGAVIDLDWVVEKLGHAQNEPDKFGNDYNAYQEALQTHKAIDFDGQQKYEQSKHDQQQASQGSSSGAQQQGQDEMAKFSEGYHKNQRANHDNQNHNNHYNAINAWKTNAHIAEEISRKHQAHQQALSKVLRDDQESAQKDNRIQQAKRRK